MSYDYQKIDKLIEQSGLEKKSFFRKAGITEKYYNNCKSGQEIPKEEIMRQIASKLDVPIREIKESLNTEISNPHVEKSYRKGTDEETPKIGEENGAHKKASRRMLKYITSNIDAYLNTDTRQYRRMAANRLRQAPYTDHASQMIKERLLHADDSNKRQLLMLLFHIDREHNIQFCLNELLKSNIPLNTVDFFVRLDANPLSNNERMEIAMHIGNYNNFDIRLLKYLQGDSLDYALEKILHYSLRNGLTSKYLFSLSVKREYLIPLQEEIRKKIISDVHMYQSWIKYLDLSLSENQCIIHNNYTLFQVYRELRAVKTEYHESPFFSIRVVQRLLHRISLDAEDWYEIKMIILQEISVTNIDDNEILIDFLRDAYYVDTAFAESMLITLYKKTTLYSRTVLDILANVQSPFAYREMVNILLTTNDATERFRTVRCLVKWYPHKSTAILEYINTLGNADLLRLAKKDIDLIDTTAVKAPPLTLSDVSKGFQIIPQTVQINELLLDLAKQIDADTVLVAVGFAFSSGLRTLSGLIEYVNRNKGNFELIIGALQNYNTNNNRKIDKNTVQLLNSLTNNREISLYTYENSFYHGKFYYIGSATQAYVIVGSSNISKTAFLENYELDVLFKIDPTQDNAFLIWYEQFKAVCTPLPSLNEANFLTLKWDSELNVFTEKFIRKLSHAEIMDTVNALSDEEVKSRILTWLKYKPTDYYSDLEIPALEGYTLFLYETYSLGVFESFSRDNAYYVFRCISVEQLLAQVAQLTKTEMANISIFMGRGYHIQNRDRLQDRISKFFEKQ